MKTNPEYVAQIMAVTHLEISQMSDAEIVDFYERVDGAAHQAANDCNWKVYDDLRFVLAGLNYLLALKFRDVVRKSKQEAA